MKFTINIFLFYIFCELCSADGPHIIDLPECASDLLCIPLSVCDPFLALLHGRKYIVRKLIQKQQCGARNDQNLKVCCPTTNHDALKMIDKSNCGTSWHHNELIGADSSDTSPGEFTWIAALGYRRNYDTNSPVDFLCTGSLVNERHVLTAASCLQENDKRKQSLVEVRLGDWNLTSVNDCKHDITGMSCTPPYQSFQPLEQFLHPQFDSLTLMNNIGLVRLEKSVKFNNEYGFLIPICLPSKNFHLESGQVGKEGVIAGWGNVNDPHKLSDTLSKIEFNFASPDSCEYSRSPHFEPKQVCFERNGEDKFACTGFTGGPLMLQNRQTKTYSLVGVIVSETIGCKESRDSSIYYVPISNHIDWMEKVFNRKESEINGEFYFKPK